MAETEPAELEDRVERLETGQDKLAGKIDELIGMFRTGGKAQAAAAEHQEAKLDRPSTIQEQVNMELERKEREAKEKADKDAEKSERQTIKEQIARLTEAKPAQPQRRLERGMWGPR